MTKYKNIDERFRIILKGTDQEKKHLDKILQELPFEISLRDKFWRDKIFKFKPKLDILFRSFLGDKYVHIDALSEMNIRIPFPFKQNVKFNRASCSYLDLIHNNISYSIHFSCRN